MKRAWFVTGTDTGVGKTLVSCALLHALRAQGLAAIGMKPVASGCRQTPDGQRHDDALALLSASSVASDYALVNPFALPEATAPHLAALANGVSLTIDTMIDAYAELREHADALVVEGVGGWLVPINANQTMADVVKRLQLPVLLVVGLRLGCLNHALLTAQAIKQAGCRLTGWVANHLAGDTASELTGYVDALRERLVAPLIGEIPYLDAAIDPQTLATNIDTKLLLVPESRYPD